MPMLQTVVPMHRLRRPRRPAPPPVQPQTPRLPVSSTVLLTTEAWAAQQGLGLMNARAYARTRRVHGMVTGLTPSGSLTLIPSGAPILPTGLRVPERVLDLIPLSRFAAECEVSEDALRLLARRGHLRLYGSGRRQYVASGTVIEPRLLVRAEWLARPQTLYDWVCLLARKGRSAAQTRDILGEARITLKTVHEYRSRARARGDL